MDVLHQVTWDRFFATVGVVFTLYYLYIGIRYFRGDILRAIRRRTTPTGETAEKKKKQTSVVLTEEQFANAFKELEEIAHDLRSRIIPGHARSKDKKTMLHRIAQRLEGFKGFIVPAFRYALHNHVMTQARKNNIPLTEEELDRTWEAILSGINELHS
ncbi:hypothetical protein OOZ15_13595 [Galbibacter sp. EGI 63066]|uniref:hypothetical protein n=1 Tax=Galbibacter sp. EGI 63066 TaxID=2993559 RepID=UPI0022487AD9|nr:hypothetical protein [Galbibacter sp. EGI 63066]MCX2680982.1 hypothetical protein [Galbibacter sp. EGI 63066]